MAQLDEKQRAIEACFCPRAAGESLTSPRCSAEQCMGSSNPVLFVNCPPGLNCKNAVTFGYGHFCNCSNRLQVYLKYGI